MNDYAVSFKKKKFTPFFNALFTLFYLSLFLFFFHHQACATPQNEPSIHESIDAITHAIQLRDKIIEKLVKKVNLLEGEIKRINNEETIRQILTPGDEATSIPETSTEKSKTSLNHQESFFEKAFAKKFEEQGNLLLPPYTQQIDIQLSSAHFANDKIIIDGFTIVPVLVVGDIVSERIRRNRYTTTLAWRMGLPQGFQIDARMPWSYLETSIVRADSVEENHFDTGFGDLELGINYQISTPSQITINQLLGLRWKTNSATDPYKIKSPEYEVTGSGFNTLSLFYTVVDIRDPLAFFGNLSFSKSLPSNKPIGRVKPGNRLGYTLGMNMAINLESTINISFSHQWSNHTSLNKASIAGTRFTSAVLSAGINQHLFDDHELNIQLGIGLTEDSPDFTIQFGIPVKL